MTKREIVGATLTGGNPPYVPWSSRFTKEPMELLCAHFSCTPEDLIEHTGCHILELGRPGGYILSPSHALESDVPMANILALLEVAQAQVT